ncbi:hypothetical protein D3C76_1734940 [compost metagenome]
MIFRVGINIGQQLLRLLPAEHLHLGFAVHGVADVDHGGVLGADGQFADAVILCQNLLKKTHRFLGRLVFRPGLRHQLNLQPIK